MPRQPRILVDGGYYHIVTRGIDRRKLFRYLQDYKYFLKTTIKYLEKFQVNILHYCLMSNHVHLLIYVTIAKELPKFMQAVLQVYASYFRKKYKSTGFIFQNRYKSKLIEKDSYLLECGRYIERNPLRANITSDLLSYPWSSFSFYAKGKHSSIIKTVNPMYLDLSDDEQKRRELYQKYILEARPYELIIDKEFRIL